MASHTVLVLLFSCVLGLFSSSSSSNGDSEVSALRNHILQLEQTVTNLETQTRMKEEKDAVLLSEVLSKLGKTTQELTNVKTVLFASSSTPHGNGLQNQIVQLEQTVADLQSKTQTQDQKCAAELSSFLTILTSTTDELVSGKAELKDMKDDYRSLQLEFSNLQVGMKKNENKVIMLSKDVNSTGDDLSKIDTKVRDIRSDLNKTEEQLVSVKSDLHITMDNVTSLKSESSLMKSEILNMKFVQDKVENMTSLVNSTVMFLAEVKGNMSFITSEQASLTSNLTDTEKMVASRTHSHNLPHVAFQVEQTGKEVSVPHDQIMKFNTIKYNSGNSYLSSTGTFTAPVSGIYLFWVNAVTGSPSTVVGVRIQKASGRIGTAYKETGEHDKADTVTAIATAYLSVGERVWFQSESSKGTAVFQGLSSYGGALLESS